jgi:hypothetical protein
MVASIFPSDLPASYNYHMSQQFEATYQHGVLRLDAPLALPENSRVIGVVRDVEAEPAADVLHQQNQALNAMFADVDRLPQQHQNDGLSNRDHNQILYGSSK